MESGVVFPMDVKGQEKEKEKTGLQEALARLAITLFLHFKGAVKAFPCRTQKSKQSCVVKAAS